MKLFATDWWLTKASWGLFLAAALAFSAAVWRAKKQESLRKHANLALGAMLMCAGSTAWIIAAYSLEGHIWEKSTAIGMCLVAAILWIGATQVAFTELNQTFWTSPSTELAKGAFWFGIAGGIVLGVLELGMSKSYGVTFNPTLVPFWIVYGVAVVGLYLWAVLRVTVESGSLAFGSLMAFTYLLLVFACPILLIGRLLNERANAGGFGVSGDRFRTVVDNEAYRTNRERYTSGGSTPEALQARERQVIDNMRNQADRAGL